MPVNTSAPIAVEDEAALRSVVQRLAKSWAQNDADALSELYAEDATVVLPGDTYLKGRPQIRSWMASAFAGKWKGTHVLGMPMEIRYIRDDVCLMISQGGAYGPGASEVSADDAIRGIWVFVKRGKDWIITAYENTPVRATIPVPAGHGR